MMLHHNFTLDLLQPGTPHRIPVKQGDTLTHSLDILLTANGEPWIFPADTTPVLRWHASDPGSGKYARGIYDTLPDGVHAWTTAENLLNIITVPQMFALPGLVRADVLLIQGEKTLATFNFEVLCKPRPSERHGTGGPELLQGSLPGPDQRRHLRPGGMESRCRPAACPSSG